ncbi:MAG TPA: ribonuclease HII [Patescibacteria group bacterium]
MIKSTFQLENKLFSDGYKIIIGIDEAGRGPLAGPVVACAATLKNLPHPPTPSPAGRGRGEGQFDLVRDSKTLSEKQREKIFDFILENFYVGVGICDHNTIDRINILEASFLAMKKAMGDLTKKIKDFPHPSALSPSGRGWGEGRCIILVDGNKKIPNLSQDQKAIVNGDKLVKSISAASIIAKVTRDRIMREIHEKYPAYGFDRHKGYGTKLHMNSLQKYGPCEIHRKSFRPVGDYYLAKRKN